MIHDLEAVLSQLDERSKAIFQVYYGVSIRDCLLLRDVDIKIRLIDDGKKLLFDFIPYHFDERYESIEAKNIITKFDSHKNIKFYSSPFSRETDYPEKYFHAIATELHFLEVPYEFHERLAEAEKK